MRYAFLNNFSQLLAADLAAGATTLTLDANGAGLSNASADLVYVLTLDDGNGAIEVIHVTGASSNTLTIERGKEGTTDQSWVTGSSIEQRLTAGVMDALMWILAAEGIASSTGIALGAADDAAAIAAAGAYGSRSMALMPGAEATDDDGFAAGNGSGSYGVRASALAGGQAYSEDAMAAGAGAEALGARALALIGGYAGGDDSFAWGVGANASGKNGLAAGANSSAGQDCISVGPGSSAIHATGIGAGIASGKNASAGPGTIAIGEDSSATSPAGQAHGKSASSNAPENVADGPGASAPTPYSVALGPYASTANVTGGFQINALSYLPATYDDTGTYAGPPPSSARRASQQVIIATDPLDLTDNTAAVTLDLLPNTMLFLDAIDVVIVGSDTPGGSPEISIGPDDVTPTAYLAATAVTKTAVGERETHSPIVSDGVTSLRVATTAAGSGTTYQAKIILRGYVMEL